jgi:hypothetical protein
MVTAKEFLNRAPASSASYAHVFAITKSDEDDVGAFLARAVWVGSEGNLHVETSGGDDVTFTAVPAGTFLPIGVRKVFEDSTAGAILGLY